MSSPSSKNFHEFQALCQTQLEGQEWTAQWPSTVDRSNVIKTLRPLALKYSGAESLDDDQVIAVFFSEQAMHLLLTMRNDYCFWAIVQEAARHIGDYQKQIVLPTVVAAMEARPDIPGSLTV